MRAALLCTIATAQLYEPDTTPQEPQRRFVVTAGCPATLNATSQIRLFVAVPSAASYTHRRQWARASWCHEARRLSIAVKFFVGAHAEIDDLQYDDIVRVPSWDGQDNVTAKQLHSMRYFSSLCGDTVRAWPSVHNAIKPTHYMRVEDDVYPFVSTIVDELTQKHIRAVPRPYDVQEPFLWALIIQGKPPYPAGSGFVLSADVVRAVAAADAVVEWDTGAPAPEQTQKPSWGKGGWRHTPYMDGSWSTDDAFVGLLVAPFRVHKYDDRRFHEAPGAGAINGWPASANSIVVAGLREWLDFFLLGQRDFDGFNQRRGTPGLDHHADGTSSLMMEVNGIQHRIDFDSCAGMGEAAAAACVSFSLDAPTCASLTAHFRRACGAAEVHKGAVLSGRLDF